MAVPIWAIAAGLGGLLGAESTYENNSKIDKNVKELNTKKKKRLEELGLMQTKGVDNINDATNNAIMQQSNIAAAQYGGAMNIPAIQAIMASRLAGSGQQQVNSYLQSMGQQRLGLESQYDNAIMGLEGQKQGYLDNILLGGLAGAGTGLNIENMLSEIELKNAIKDKMLGQKVNNSNVTPTNTTTSTNTTTPTNTPVQGNSLNDAGYTFVPYMGLLNNATITAMKHAKDIEDAMNNQNVVRPLWQGENVNGVRKQNSLAKYIEGIIPNAQTVSNEIQNFNTNIPWPPIINMEGNELRMGWDVPNPNNFRDIKPTPKSETVPYEVGAKSELVERYDQLFPDTIPIKKKKTNKLGNRTPSVKNSIDNKADLEWIEKLAPFF